MKFGLLFRDFTDTGALLENLGLTLRARTPLSSSGVEVNRS